MLIMDLVGLVLILVVVGVILLMLSPLILLFVHLNRKMWRLMNPPDTGRLPQRDDGEWVFVQQRSDFRR